MINEITAKAEAGMAARLMAEDISTSSIALLRDGSQ